MSKNKIHNKVLKAYFPCLETRIFVNTAKYVSTNDGGGCCFKGSLGDAAKNAIDNYHRSCLCPQASDINECQRLCSVDTKCKGYAVHKNSDTCIIATSSLCPSECHGPYGQDNIGPIDMDAEKCAQGDFNQGCYVKQSGNLNLIDLLSVNGHDTV